MRAPTLIALVAAAGLAGCSPTPPPSANALVAIASPSTAVPSAASVPPSTAPSASPPTPTPTPSQDEIRKAAAKAYLAAVLPANKASDALFKRYRNQTSLAAHRQYCSKLAAVDRRELLALRAITYPTDTASDARLLIRAAAAEEADFRSCAVARNVPDWNRAWNLASSASDRGHEAANLVRLDLNLPPVPG